MTVTTVVLLSPTLLVTVVTDRGGVGQLVGSPDGVGAGVEIEGVGAGVGLIVVREGVGAGVAARCVGAFDGADVGTPDGTPVGLLVGTAVGVSVAPVPPFTAFLWLL